MLLGWPSKSIAGMVPRIVDNQFNQNPGKTRLVHFIIYLN